MKPIWTSFLPSCASASTILRASSEPVAKGFSHRTGLLLRRHSSTSPAWVSSGEAIRTASMPPSSINERASSNTLADPHLAATASARAGLASVTPATLTPTTLLCRLSACLVPMAPAPTTPTATPSESPRILQPLTYRSLATGGILSKPSPGPQYLDQFLPVRFIQLSKWFPGHAGRETREVHRLLYGRDTISVAVLGAQPLHRSHVAPHGADRRCIAPSQAGQHGQRHLRGNVDQARGKPLGTGGEEERCP